MISYIPVLTTLLSVFFLGRIVPHYLSKRSAYLLWWTLGVLTFGLGTLTESINAISGWSEWNTRVWYLVGALLGGYPLAQGTIYLLMKKRFADVSAAVCSAVILVGAICVLLSPIEVAANFDHRLSGKVFVWQWVRGFSPLLNLYAFVFLFGGAIYSAVKYFANDKGRTRFLGNILIAIGALLPGIGGSFTRFGYVEVLYVTELIGLSFIYSDCIVARRFPFGMFGGARFPRPDRRSPIPQRLSIHIGDLLQIGSHAVSIHDGLRLFIILGTKRQHRFSADHSDVRLHRYLPSGPQCPAAFQEPRSGSYR